MKFNRLETIVALKKRNINNKYSCFILNKDKKLDKIIKIHDEQQGFRGNRSCIDAIFAIRQLSEKAYSISQLSFASLISKRRLIRSSLHVSSTS